METANIQEFIELYVECPYCCALQSDNDNRGVEDFDESTMICKSCKKTFYIKK